MCNVDQADQLRLQYCIHYWIRNTKWWWALFFWIFESSLTNCYIIYKKFHELHERKHLSHYKFIKQVALAWINPSEYWSSLKQGIKQSTSQVSADASTTTSMTTCTSVASTIISPRKTYLNQKNSAFTEKTLDPYNGALQCRLDHQLNHLPIKNDKPENNCQLHYWSDKTKVQAQLMKCMTCNVTLCLSCYKPFHEIAALKQSRLK